MTTPRQKNGELLAALQKVAEEHAITGATASRLMMAAIVDARSMTHDLAEKFERHMADEEQIWRGVTAALQKLDGIPGRVVDLEKADRRWTAALGLAAAVGTLVSGVVVLVLKALGVI